MQIIENNLIKEKVYIEKLESGITIMCIPKEKAIKKYAICGIGFGSNDNKFFIEKDNKEVSIPDGVAHFLEHKLFEKEDGQNSLDVLSALGVDANAYTTNDHTAYLFECTKNFYEALDELLNYVQNPYFTDENVEKEKGIIAQEIKMYDDEADFKVYLNAMKAMYTKNPIRIDVAGSVESIQKINKDILYECYNNFYTTSNMVIVVCGDFKPEEIFEEIKKRITKPNRLTAKRIEENEGMEINQKEITAKMDISMPIFIYGFKVNPIEKEKIKRNLSIEILLEILFGQSSELYEKLYNQGLIYEGLSASFEWARNYAHVLIQGKSHDIEKVENEILDTIKKLKQNGINEKEFEKAKRKIYGEYVRQFNEVDITSGLFVTNYFKGINPFEYVENYKTISKEYIENTLKEVFTMEKMVKSSIIPN